MADDARAYHYRSRLWAYLWDLNRTLYHDLHVEELDADTRDALEAEGHMSPDRVPPSQVQEWVRRR